MIVDRPSQDILDVVRPVPRSAELVRAFERACVAACNCLTKTPEIKAHADGCPYKVMAVIAASLREEPQDCAPICWGEANSGLPAAYLRSDLAFGRGEGALTEVLAELASHLRALLPRAKFHEADPRPLMAALSKAEAVLSRKPSLVPMENQDDD